MHGARDIADARRPARPTSQAARARARARRRAAVRRRRALLFLVIGGVTALLATSLGGGGTTTAPSRRALRPRTAAARRSPGPLRVGASLLSWHLPAPLSREVVVPTPSGELRVLGGLDLAGGTVSTSYLLAPTTGAVGPAASLAEPTHDAAGTLLGSSALVVGGGSVAPAAAVQLAPASATATVTVSGQLTVARADARAVTIGDTAYVVGGYDGPSMDTAVLATTDGRVFRQVATLPVPVRYPTLAVADGVVYVLGGQNAAGAPVPTVQEIDPHSGRAVVTGSLGVPLAASVATTVDGTIYLAGGLVTGPGGIVPTTAVFAYRPGAADVQHVATLPVAVANAGAARLGTRLYVLGGENAAGTPVDDAQVVTFTHGPAATARPASGPGR